MPARQSESKKRAKGSARADRAPKPDPTQKLTTAPRAPAHLTDRARAEWRTLAGMLVRAGGLCEMDLRLLELCCVALADEAAAAASLLAEGFTITSGAVVKQHPAVRIGREARATAIRLLLELGCSPVSRTRLDLRPPVVEDPDGPWATFARLQGGRDTGRKG